MHPAHPEDAAQQPPNRPAECEQEGRLGGGLGLRMQHAPEALSSEPRAQHRRGGWSPLHRAPGRGGGSPALGGASRPAPGAELERRECAERDAMATRGRSRRLGARFTGGGWHEPNDSRVGAILQGKGPKGDSRLPVSTPNARGPSHAGEPGPPAPNAGSISAPGGSRGPAGDGLSPAARMPMTSGGFSAHPHFRLTRL